jgi:hypothetical protein
MIGRAHDIDAFPRVHRLISYAPKLVNSFSYALPPSSPSSIDSDEGADDDMEEGAISSSVAAGDDDAAATGVAAAPALVEFFDFPPPSPRRGNKRASQRGGRPPMKPRRRFRVPKPRACLPITIIIGTQEQQQRLRQQYDALAEQERKETAARLAPSAQWQPVHPPPDVVVAAEAEPAASAAIWYECPVSASFARGYPSLHG